MTEYESEPIPGLPEALPRGEAILWQGAPDWRSLWRRAFHGRKLAVYFALLLLWVTFSMSADGAPVVAVIARAIQLTLCAAGALAVLAALSYYMSRSTVYTVTTERVVMRFGLALPMAINLPFNIIESVDAKLHDDGSGDFSLRLGARQTMGYAVLWPHARPWRFGRPEPTLRCVPNADRVASLLSQAMRAAIGGTASPARSDQDDTALPELVPGAG